jgi:hypothetical protein
VPGNVCGEVAWNCPELKQRKRDCGQMQKIATGIFIVMSHKFWAPFRNRRRVSHTNVD